jgi:CheY-like chemotaxis protein
LFLHRVVSNLPKEKRALLADAWESRSSLAGKKVLVVDDDVRNIYALTSGLERHGMDIFSAENGKAAIKMLQETPDIELVLMDVMMPEMDGYETMREIRKEPRFAGLPIIALTAKAMKGDREKCIGAGASDYISKPVDMDQLVSLMRVWLYR